MTMNDNDNEIDYLDIIMEIILILFKVIFKQVTMGSFHLKSPKKVQI